MTLLYDPITKFSRATSITCLITVYLLRVDIWSLSVFCIDHERSTCVNCSHQVYSTKDPNSHVECHTSRKTAHIRKKTAESILALPQKAHVAPK